tara:strand:- start:1877 stop:2293 length:417 start_codon:yes stop_codon:yes gene_type:complete
MNYSDVLQNMNSQDQQHGGHMEPQLPQMSTYQDQMGPPLPQMSRDPHGPDIRHQFDVPNNGPPVKKAQKPLMDKALQHEIICLIASQVIIQSDPIQNVLKNALPTIFTDTGGILKTVIQGLCLALAFILLRKATIDLM